jgi:hypothetical protein
LELSSVVSFQIDQLQMNSTWQRSLSGKQLDKTGLPVFVGGKYAATASNPRRP